MTVTDFTLLINAIAHTAFAAAALIAACKRRR